MAIKRFNMNRNPQNIKNLTAKVIVGVLLIANFTAFVAGSKHFSLKSENYTETQEEKFEVLKSGWQLMHWSYSLLRHFKGTPAE